MKIAITTMLQFFSVFMLVFSSIKLFGQTNDTATLDYAPYLNGKPWPQIQVIAYVETTSNLWVHPTDPKHFPSMQETFDPDSDFTTVVLRLPDGSVYKTYNNFVMGPYLSAVYSGDFNHDGKPDFLAVKPSAGNGLAGEYCTGVFAFSDDDGYRFTRVRTMDLEPEDLAIDPATKQFRFIQTSFRDEQTLDGRDHSFWVQRFYIWNSESFHFQEDPNLPPIWIQYLYRSNHEPTKLLTPALKTKIWAEDPESNPGIEW